MLPELDGLAVIRAVRRDDEAADTPILMLSARELDLDRIAGLEDGADDYLPKPFSPGRAGRCACKSILRRATARRRRRRPRPRRTPRRRPSRLRHGRPDHRSATATRCAATASRSPLDARRVPAARGAPRGRRPGAHAATSCSTRSTATTTAEVLDRTDRRPRRPAARQARRRRRRAALRRHGPRRRLPGARRRRDDGGAAADPASSPSA